MNDVLPHNLELEQALLGTLMLMNDRVHQVTGLMPEHFYERLHGEIYAKIVERVMAEKDAIPATLHDYFSFDTLYNEVGGAAYLARLRASGCPRSREWPPSPRKPQSRSSNRRGRDCRVAANRRRFVPPRNDMQIISL